MLISVKVLTKYVIIIYALGSVHKKFGVWIKAVPKSLQRLSLLRRGLFVLWGGWGERKRESAGHDGKGEERREAVSLFPSSPARFLFFRLLIFWWDTQREPLRRRELQRRNSPPGEAKRTAESFQIESGVPNWFRRRTFHVLGSVYEPGLMETI